MDALSVNQCVVVNFTDVNGVRMPIWQTARQQPGQRKCQQKLLHGVEMLAAQPDLVHKLLWNVVVDYLASDYVCSVSWQLYGNAGSERAIVMCACS
jgi:hypothetical protein